MTRADHLGTVVALRQLAGRELPVHKRIGDIRAGVERLETATRSWPAFAPRSAALDEAITQIDAVARAMREMRAAMHAEGPPDVA